MTGLLPELPEECVATIEHALIHINSALDDLNDHDQIEHELYMTRLILQHIELISTMRIRNAR